LKQNYHELNFQAEKTYGRVCRRFQKNAGRISSLILPAEVKKNDLIPINDQRMADLHWLEHPQKESTGLILALSDLAYSSESQY